MTALARPYYEEAWASAAASTLTSGCRAGQLGALARRRLTSGDSQMTSADPKMGSDEVIRLNSPKKRLLYSDIGGIKAISN